jgi:cyclohexa-1,5-dienecarbonyl-CoA hydratase
MRRDRLSSPDAPLTVERSQDGGVLFLTLARPKANILDGTMIHALGSAIRQHGETTTLRAILLSASGPHFSFGASVEEHRSEHVREMMHAIGGLFRDLLDLEVPLVSAVRGQCLGGGFELALLGSFIFAAPDAQLGAPEIKLGVFAPLASVLLPQRIGLAGAERILLTGEPVGAEKALQLGLIDGIDPDPQAAALRLIEQQLLPRSGTSLRYALRAARFIARPQLLSNLAELERLYLEELMATHDANEGIASFLEKRPPRWNHTGGR